MEVLVVGAGAAGLAAAASLRRAGVGVEVLEARERSGGRILTLHDEACPVSLELGAEFVHGDAPLTRALLGPDACVPVDADAWEGQEGRLRPADTWERIERVLSGLEEEGPRDRTFGEYLRARDDLDEEDAARARAFVEGFFAADAERIGTHALAREGTDAARDSCRVAGGYDRLVRRLEEGALVHHGHAVRRIEWVPGRVSVRGVHAASGLPFTPREARALVLTVPLGVLAATNGGRPLLSPTAPRLVEARSRLAMGHAVRFLVVFRRPVREVLGFDGFLHAPDEAPQVFWTLEPISERILVAWAGGPRAVRLPQRAGGLCEVAVDVLARATGAAGRDIERAVMAVRWHDWSADPWARGAYAYPRVGGDGAADALAEAEGGTVFLAGEATSSAKMGTVEGALESGERAADQVLETLGRAGA